MKPNEIAFQRLKALEGEWLGTSCGGAKELSLRYEVASKQSVVIEFYRHTFKEKNMEDEMVTVYHPNGDELMLTHYCTLGNQPRMIADLADTDANTLAFRYVSATNLTHEDCLVMSGVSFNFLGPDQFEQTWYWRGKKCHVDPNHHSDDYDDLPDDGDGEDRFILNRVSGPRR